MALRTIRQQAPAVRDDIADLVTRRALPTQYINHIDPFLFLNHHGPQTYSANNRGLPFGPHPHRGFETVTFILKGELTHEDTAGHSSLIRAGGVQWMTTGSGLIHSEISSEEFKKKGGDLEILQLWVNLPAKLKMTQPKYVGLQREQIPSYQIDDGKVIVQLVSGSWDLHRGPFNPLTDIQLMILDLEESGRISFSIPPERNIFFYVVGGEISVNENHAKAYHLIHFENDGDELHIHALKDSVILFGHAEPYGEPIVAHGPFVMNTREEILQAIQDYKDGKFR